MVISNNGKIGSGTLIKTCYVEDENIIRNDFDDKKARYISMNVLMDGEILSVRDENCDFIKDFMIRILI